MPTSERTAARRREQRRARVAVMSGAALFLLTQLGLGFVTTAWRPELRDPYYGQKVRLLQRRLADAPASPSTVVMVGSSRTAYGFAPARLEERLEREAGRPVVAFNFGLFGAGPATELLTLRRLLDDGIRPSLLLVEVLPPLLAAQVPLNEFNRERLPTWKLRATEVALVEEYGGALRPGLRPAWYRTCLLPTYYLRLPLLNHAFPVLLGCANRTGGFAEADGSGWTPAPPLTPERRKRNLVQAEKEYGLCLQGFRPGGPAAEGLCQVLELCRKEGIPAALVVMPEGPVFRGFYPPESWPRVESYLDELSRRYGVPWLNARHWFGEEAFTDSHHLRPEGAAVFTQQLTKEIIAPLLRQQARQPITTRPGHPRQRVAAGGAAGRASGDGG
ncbi:MAG: hypothetical protein HYS12_12770 [Planctomycetes bacterium]|nr:hypothetical protein [Planctomycetota bacterium]